MIRPAIALAVLAFSTPAHALLNVSQALNARSLPPGVSMPTIANTDAVYPGCPVPPTTFGNLWHFDPAGSTMAAYTTAGISLNPLVTPHQGDATHPWNNLQAMLTTQSGYTTTLLSTVNGSTGPIQPGDEVVLATGNYGAISGGALFNPSAQIINSPALTIVPGAGQTPVITELRLFGVTGFVFNGGQVRSLNTDGNPLVEVRDGNNAGFSNSNVVIENMDISSADVATADGWTQAQFIANARPGLILAASDSNTALSCVSSINNHVYVTNEHNSGAISAYAADALVQNNEVDHFSTTAIQFAAGNTAILKNYVHDLVENGQGDQHYAIEDAAAFGSSQVNVFVSQNKVIESIDASQTFQGVLNGYLNSCGDMTNLVFTDSLFAISGGSGIAIGNTHNGVVANNSIIAGSTLGATISAAQGHCGTTGDVGNPTSYVRLFNNVSTAFIYYGINVQGDHNISTQTSGSPPFPYIYYDANNNEVFDSNTPGSVTAVSAVSGASNLKDGLGQANEFTAVPTAGSFPMSPQPDWTPLSGSPAKTAGGAVLIPPITDYNGAAFTSPFSRGGLN